MNIRDNNGQTALMIVCKKKNVEIVSIMAKLSIVNCDIVDNAGATALILACQTINSDDLMLSILDTDRAFETVQILLDARVDPNVKDCTGKNALMYMCKHFVFSDDNIERLMKFINSSQDSVLIKDTEGKSALDYFIENPTRTNIDDEYIESLLKGSTRANNTKSANNI